MEQAPKVEETSSGTSALDDGLGAAVIGCIGHDGDCCKDRDAEKIDAARYRWLKRQPWVKTKGIHAWGALLDNAIDEARHDAPNVQVTGAARLYRAASSDRRERGRPAG